MLLTIDRVDPWVRIPPWGDFEFIYKKKEKDKQLLRAPINGVGKHNCSSTPVEELKSSRDQRWKSRPERCDTIYAI